jgi:anti-sigma factor RsiW
VANDDVVSQMRLHQECWELLPWVVNGRLSGTDAARVNEHLRECARCTEELQAQQQLYEALRHDDAVLLAPQASLKKLWKRLDGTAAPTQAEQAVPAAARHAPAADARDAEGAHWRRMRAVLAAQTLLIVGLLGLAGWQTFERWQAPRFVTVTSPSAVTGTVRSVRVVFAPTAAMQDINRLLRALRLEVLDGPSSAGVFTLGLPGGTNADVVARQLRGDVRIQFAEAMLTKVQP